MIASFEYRGKRHLIVFESADTTEHVTTFCGKSYLSVNGYKYISAPSMQEACKACLEATKDILARIERRDT